MDVEKAAARYGVQSAVILGGLSVAVLGASAASNIIVITGALLCIVGLLMLLINPFVASVPSKFTPAKRWVYKAIAAHAHGILGAIKAERIDNFRTNYQSRIDHYLPKSRFAAALCGDKRNGVNNIGAYYKLFYDFAENQKMLGDETCVIRSFTVSADQKHIDDHRNAHKVLPAITSNAHDLEMIEQSCPGIQDLLRNGLGFVIFAGEFGVAAVVHEMVNGRFTFWESQDRMTIEFLLRLFREIVTRSSEYQDEDNKRKIKRFIKNFEDRLNDTRLLA